jgi:hypothetical protein
MKERNLSALFSKPVELKDQSGSTIITKRATGHAVACDWNKDGKTDLLLGCYRNMKGEGSEILFIENVGSKDKPAFKWPAARAMQTLMFEGKEEPYQLNVAHRGSATLEICPCDQDGDGTLDLIIDGGKHRGLDVCHLPGKKTSKPVPEFGFWSRFHNIVRGLPQNSGGGDWNGDSIMDYVLIVNETGWQVHRGLSQKHGLPRIEHQASLNSRSYSMIGQDGWFYQTPYAWNFSGLCKKTGTAGTAQTLCAYCDRFLEMPLKADSVEIVAVMPRKDKDDEKKTTGSLINYYVLDHASRTCRLLGTITETDIAAARLSIGDMNHDGCMDIIFTGGLSQAGDETKIYVIYGRIENIR